MTQALARKRYALVALLLLCGVATLVWALLAEMGETDDDQPVGARPIQLSVGDPLMSPADAGELVVLAVSGPTTVQYRRGQPTGYEADLARAFGEHLGLPVRFELKNDLSELFRSLAVGEGHLAASGLSIADTGGEAALRGPAYKNVQVQLVCPRNGPSPATLSAIGGIEIRVAAGSPWIDLLARVQRDVPTLTWKEVAGSELALLEAVAESDDVCAAAGSNIVALARTRLVGLTVPLSLSRDDLPLTWAISPRHVGVLDEVHRWMDEAHADDLLEALDERYYGHLGKFDYVDLSVFKRRVATRLPIYEPYFRNAAEATLFHWTLLAAQGYQESHWDPEAKSPTGVRGIMMLTQPTAREVGIENRLDPAQSIDGGSRYLDRLFERLPEEVEGRDRLWFALAAYNVGYGHLQDARRLAEREGLASNEWHVMDDVLPRLSDPAVYGTLRHGYARGGEPVAYVRRIRTYHEALADEIAGIDGRPPLFLRRPTGG